MNHPRRSKHSPARPPTPIQIRAARERAGLTQTEAADLIWIGLRQWQRYEDGTQPMHPAYWLAWQVRRAERTETTMTSEQIEIVKGCIRSACASLGIG